MSLDEVEMWQVLGLPYYAFYLLPARFWELAAGVILYLCCNLAAFLQERLYTNTA